MDVKKYIESGILELYVLGRLSAREALVVEQNANNHPEISAEIGQIEESLEELGFRMAEDVSPEVLDQIIMQLRRQRDAATSDGAVRKTTPSRSGLGGRGLVFALLALVSALVAAWFWSANNKNKTQLFETQQQLEQLRRDCAATSAQEEAGRQILANITAPDTRSIILKDTDEEGDKVAVVFYNPTDQAAFFSASSLPVPPSGKQYQLWAIDGDGPKSLGVLDLDISAETVLTVDFVPNAAAFAITLEDLGGKPTPDLEQLQVIGEV